MSVQPLAGGRDEPHVPPSRTRLPEAVTLFLAGHETTSAALTWTWWLLSQHPAAEARLHDELDRELADRSPTVSDLDRLPYTEAVLSESMRLRPPAWAIGRQAVVDHDVGGRTLPAGGVAVVSPWNFPFAIPLTQAATDFLVDHGYDEHFGARPLKRAIQKYVEDPLSEKILVGDFAKGDEIEVDVAPDKERLGFRALSGSKA